MSSLSEAPRMSNDGSNRQVRAAALAMPAKAAAMTGGGRRQRRGGGSGPC
jgi:hypothetical protein